LEAKFCTKCGNQIEEEIHRYGYCPFCGTKDEGRRFCPECGARLEEYGSLIKEEVEAVTPSYEAAAATTEKTAETTAAKGVASTTTKYCPTCNNPLYYVQQYNQWYCYTCKAYKQVT